ncbi:hypothetical protein PTI98_007185 [Pleurotus ostreatus]|nr:hypothetical protein PTI98_007185 [Pleurotus ostreatus]
MSSLEWFWGMKHGSLNLDTRYNVFPILRSSVYMKRISGGYSHQMTLFITMPEDLVLVLQAGLRETLYKMASSHIDSFHFPRPLSLWAFYTSMIIRPLILLHQVALSHPSIHSQSFRTSSRTFIPSSQSLPLVINWVWSIRIDAKSSSFIGPSFGH